MKTKKQQDPIMLDDTGVVVNGNRRICTFRLKPDEWNNYVDCIILPRSTEEEIEDLENTLQIKKDHKAPYSWIATAKRINAYFQQKLSPEEIAGRLGKSSGDIELMKDMYIYSKEYLKFINKESIWSELESSEEAVRTLTKNRKSFKRQNEKDDFKATVFHIIQAPVKDRKYNLINKTQTYFNDIKKEIEKNKLDIKDNDLKNSIKITRAIECVIDIKKEKESESLQLLKASSSLSPVKRLPKERKLNHKVTREELDGELDKILKI